MTRASAVLTLMLAGVQTMSPAHTQRVWWWFATCSGPLMTVEVIVQGTTVLKVQVPLCRASRESQGAHGGAGQMDFSFRPRRALVWRGYRDEDDRTPAGQLIQGSLWEAGADPDDLLLGVSFSAAGRGLMNTIHIAHPHRRDQSTIATGITVTTYPAGR